MTNETLRVLRHIFDARIDNVTNINSYLAWTSARDIVEYALADNLECLAQFDYLETKGEQKQWALYTKCPFLPGRVVNFLIIEKGIDKVKEICYTLVTIKKGRIENGKNLYSIGPL